MDMKRVMDRLRGKTAPGAFPEKEPDPSDAAEGDEAHEAGEMLLAAVKAGDAAGVEEAIKRCVGDDSY